MVQVAPAESSAIVVQTENLSKSYGKLQALDLVSLRVSAACTGLLGPNGAGKSTLIKLLLGLLSPDGGTATVAGCDVLTQPLELRAFVGYMPEHDCLPTDWLAQDFVRYMAELHGLPSRVAIQRASDTLYHVGLGEERYRAIGGFSTGMKQRVKLAQALVHDPRVMLLDEPTNGLDPAGRDEMIALIGRIAHEMGIHVLLSSHLLTDVERVADSVIMLNQGKVVAEGSLASLTTTTGTVSVRTRGEGSALAQWLQAHGYTVRPPHNGYEFEIGYPGDEVYDAIRDAAVATQTPIMYLKRRSLTLEDIYLAGESGATVSPPARQKDEVAK
jgi:ABC-2 type transport system ATP-binding protein